MLVVRDYGLCPAKGRAERGMPPAGAAILGLGMSGNRAGMWTVQAIPAPNPPRATPSSPSPKAGRPVTSPPSQRTPVGGFEPVARLCGVVFRASVAPGATPAAQSLMARPP